MSCLRTSTLVTLVNTGFPELIVHYGGKTMENKDRYSVFLIS